MNWTVEPDRMEVAHSYQKYQITNYMACEGLKIKESDKKKTENRSNEGLEQLCVGWIFPLCFNNTHGFLSLWFGTDSAVTGNAVHLCLGSKQIFCLGFKFKESFVWVTVIHCCSLPSPLFSPFESHGNKKSFTPS